MGQGAEAQHLKLVLCLTGKTFKGPISALVEDYRERISHYAPIEIIEAKELKLQSRPGLHVVLSPAGKQLDSEGLAALIEKQLNQGTKHMYFYVGGPEGFDPAIEAAADEKISFSRMTFNHQIIRIMILEQLYRAFTIIRGEHYHK